MVVHKRDERSFVENGAWNHVLERLVDGCGGHRYLHRVMDNAVSTGVLPRLLLPHGAIGC